MKNFIFFRNDRLGDFIILTSIIKSIKKKYKDSHITILASDFNHKFIKKYKIIDKVYVYNKKNSLKEKFYLLKKIINKDYFASFAVDGKSFSNLCNFLIKAKYKLGLVYKYKLLNFWFSKPNFLYNYLVFNKYETFTSKNDLKKIEHLPRKLINLGNFFKLNLKTTDKYYFTPSLIEEKNFRKYYSNKIKKKYIIIHLDEKWNDIKSVNSELFLNLVNFQKKIKHKLIITSFNNRFNYFINLKKKILNSKNKNLLLLENTNLFFFERLINYSYCSISCHSGFVVQIAGANSARLIDIINKKDHKWYNCWKPKNTFHNFIFKSNNNKKFFISVVFKNIFFRVKKLKNF